MSIENHEWNDSAVTGCNDKNGYVELYITDSDYNFMCAHIVKEDVEALARHFNLIPDPKTPEEVADIERLVASSSRLNNGG